MKETRRSPDQENFSQLAELRELVNRVLVIGRKLRIVLAEQMDTQEEEAAWAGLMVIEQNIQDNLYFGNPQKIAEDLELAQKYLRIVFPRLKKIQDEIQREITTLHHYAGGLPEQKPR